MLDKIAEASLLFDFYGQLLTERQRQVMNLYHEENYSLSEIAAEISISRQGVHDALKNAEKALGEYERKLGLVSRFTETRQAIGIIDSKLEEIISENKDDDRLVAKLKEIESIIDNIE